MIYTFIMLYISTIWQRHDQKQEKKKERNQKYNHTYV